MKRRRIVISAALGIVFCVLAWALWPGPTEPVYQGKSLSKWLERYYVDAEYPPSGLLVADVDDAVRHMGTNAIPFLLSMLGTKDSPVKTKLIGLLEKQSLVKVHLTYARTRRERAARAFSALGAIAKPALPAMGEMFRQAKGPERIQIGESISYILPSSPVASVQKKMFGTIETYDYSKPSYKLSRTELLNLLGKPSQIDETRIVYNVYTNGSSNWHLQIEIRDDAVVQSSVLLIVF